MAEWPCCHDPLRFSPASLRFVPPPFLPRNPPFFILPMFREARLLVNNCAKIPNTLACPTTVQNRLSVLKLDAKFMSGLLTLPSFFSKSCRDFRFAVYFDIQPRFMSTTSEYDPCDLLWHVKRSMWFCYDMSKGARASIYADYKRGYGYQGTLSMACRSAFNIDIFLAQYNAPHCYSSWVVRRLMNGNSGPKSCEHIS